MSKPFSKPGSFRALVATAASVLAIIAVAWTADDRFAHADDLKQAIKTIKGVADRLDQKINADLINSLQSQIWSIQGRHGKQCGTELEVCRSIQQQLDAARSKQKNSSK